MTALVASFGFLPMALSHGDRCGGAKTARHSGCGGTDNLCTALTLIVLPAVYEGVYKKVKRNDFKQNIRCRRCSSSARIAAGAQKRLTMQECIDMAVKNNYGIRGCRGRSGEIATDARLGVGLG